MNNTITQVSAITAQDVASYLRLPELTQADTNTINTMIGVAQDYIKHYTGQTDLDQFPDFVQVVFVLCEDMWDTRTLYVDKSNLNNMVETILGMHSINLLPTPEVEGNA